MAVALPSQLLLSFQGVSTSSVVDITVLMGSQNTTLAFGQPAVDSFVSEQWVGNPFARFANSSTSALRTLQDGRRYVSRPDAKAGPCPNTWGPDEPTSSSDRRSRLLVGFGTPESMEAHAPAPRRTGRSLEEQLAEIDGRTNMNGVPIDKAGTRARRENTSSAAWGAPFLWPRDGMKKVMKDDLKTVHHIGTTHQELAGHLREIIKLAREAGASKGKVVITYNGQEIEISLNPGKSPQYSFLDNKACPNAPDSRGWSPTWTITNRANGLHVNVGGDVVDKDGFATIDEDGIAIGVIGWIERHGFYEGGGRENPYRVDPEVLYAIVTGRGDIASLKAGRESVSDEEYYENRDKGEMTVRVEIERGQPPSARGREYFNWFLQQITDISDLEELLPLAEGRRSGYLHRYGDLKVKYDLPPLIMDTDLEGPEAFRAGIMVETAIQDARQHKQGVEFTEKPPETGSDEINLYWQGKLIREEIRKRQSLLENFSEDEWLRGSAHRPQGPSGSESHSNARTLGDASDRVPRAPAPDSQYTEDEWFAGVPFRDQSKARSAQAEGDPPEPAAQAKPRPEAEPAASVPHPKASEAPKGDGRRPKVGRRPLSKPREDRRVDLALEEIIMGKSKPPRPLDRSHAATPEDILRSLTTLVGPHEPNEQVTAEDIEMFADMPPDEWYGMLVEKPPFAEITEEAERSYRSTVEQLGGKFEKGWFHFSGGERGRQTRGRVYFCVNPEHAEEFARDIVREVLAPLGQRVDDFKVAGALAGINGLNERTDGAVLYFYATYERAVIDRVIEFIRRHPEYTEDVYHPFAAQLVDHEGRPLAGVTLGENPTTHHSLNDVYSNVIHNAFQDAREQVRAGRSLKWRDIARYVDIYFRKYGVDPRQPAFYGDGSSRFPYALGHVFKETPIEPVPQRRARDKSQDSSDEWTREGFRVEKVIEEIKGPWFEAGGPTPRYRLIGEITALARKLGRKIYVSNKAPGSPLYDVHTGKFLGYRGKVDLQADMNGLPFGDGSVGVIFGSCLEWSAKSFAQAYRVLEDGGLLIVQGYNETNFELATRAGFEVVKNSYSNVPGESIVIFQKPSTPTPKSAITTTGGTFEFTGRPDGVLRPVYAAKTGGGKTMRFSVADTSVSIEMSASGACTLNVRSGSVTVNLADGNHP